MRALIGLIFIFTSSVAAATATGPTNFADLYEEHSKSVVTVYTASVTNKGGKPGVARGVGSGVLIEEDKILTAAHVVDGTDSIEVLFPDGERIMATVIASLKASDIALVQLEHSPTEPHVATMADSDQTRIGSQVFVIGSPYGISQTLSIGHLSGRVERGELPDGSPVEFLQTDTAINTGNSGGPIYNTDGEVIGIVSFILTKSGGFDGIGFATSINTAKEALLTSSGVLAGFEGIILDETMASTLNFPGPGMLVQRVVSDSVLGEAGLKAGTVQAQVAGQPLLLGGDFILEINGLRCETAHDFELIRLTTYKLVEEESYDITVFRNGKVMTFQAGTNPGELYGNL